MRDSPVSEGTSVQAGPEQARWGWIESAVLAGYAVVVALGIAWHEPWADEAQAWLLARDNGWWHMMVHAIRYEGSPGLWHSVLWVLARLHISYAGMHWVSGAIAAAGVFVLLRWSPFPLILRILLPFGFWLAYQDAVVARSYVLFAVLAFPASAILRAGARAAPGQRRLIALAVLLGLMANISVHGFISSIGFAVAAWVLLRRQALARHPASRRTPVLVLCAFWVIAIATALPPADVNFAAGSNIRRTEERVSARLGDTTAKAQLPGKPETGDVRPGELAPIRLLVVHRTPVEAFWRRIARILSLLTYPVSRFRWLALATCILIVAQAIALRPGPGQLGWIGLLPWAIMVLLFASMYMQPRHAGMLWESEVAALWLTWPAAPAAGARARWLQRATLAALILCCLDQVWWTAHSVGGDMRGPYSGDVAMARFLKARGPGKRIAGFYYHSIGVAAWFDHPIFYNQPTAYWVWSRRLRIDQEAAATIATHPDLIVVGEWEWSARNGNISDDWSPIDPRELHQVPRNDLYRIVPYAEAHGYHITHRFCGHSFMRAGYAEELCQVALEPNR